jgi:NAD(P)-dependent dehydrogenase (short-subunit alcohol dehydrogenase family)
MAKYVQDFNKNLEFSGEVAIITGGASGIGKETAKLFHEKGAKVVIFDSAQNVEEVARGISPSVLGVNVDITSKEQVDKAVAAVVKQLGGVDILCNVAGVGSSTWAVDISEEEWNKVIDVNLTGTFLMCQSVGKAMIDSGKGGKIVNVSSQAGIVALDGHVAYSASKAGVLAVTRALALEWGKYNINVNAVSPTVVLTPMSADYWTGERAEKHLELIPSGRFGYMDEIAFCILYLASDAAGIINGANIVMDGGFTIR